LAHATSGASAKAAKPAAREQSERHLDAARKLIEVECDEVALDRD
jgi:hypothetical protein